MYSVWICYDNQFCRMEKTTASQSNTPEISLQDEPANNSASDSHTNNLSINEIDDDTEHILRGDAIGDTMYSQSFAVKTLLKLSDIQWNADLEEDLCFLWDMTVEKDVCAYLFTMSYPSIACDVIMKYDENRLIEIIIGIFANILCGDCEKNVSQEEAATVLNVLESDDPLILVQVVRFIKAMSHVDPKLTFITSDVLNKLSFILANSLNQDLLLKSLDALSSVMVDNKLDKDLVKSELFSSSLTAYQVIRKSENDGCMEEYFSADMQTAFTHLMNIVTSFATFLDDLDEKQTILSEIKDTCTSLINEVSEILHFYKKEENLFPLSESFTFYIESLSYACSIFEINYDKTLFINILSIVNLLIKHNSLDISMFSELLCYLVSVSNVDLIKKDLESFSEKEVALIMEKYKSDLKNSDSECCHQILKNYVH